MKRYFFIRCCAPLALTGLLAACASSGPAPVEDRSLDPSGPVRATPRTEEKPPSTPHAASYRVQRGDTLYSIAFRNGVDFRELASWNGIGAPYTIYVGQELRLAANTRTPARPNTVSSAPAIASANAPRPPPPPGSTTTAVRPAGAGVPVPTPFENVDARAASAAPATAPVPAQTATPTAPVATNASPPPIPAPPKPVEPAPAPAPASAPPQSANIAGEISWRWPADGQVIGGFVGGDQTRQGIDIAGKAGDPVRSAADGSVVYSGNGLIGYGELIIVKHSPGFLSAYGHNRKRLVKEGDSVKAGQVIAEMGSSSASRDSLHFEIRKNGKPANPVDYLPRR